MFVKPGDIIGGASAPTTDLSVWRDDTEYESIMPTTTVTIGNGNEYTVTENDKCIRVGIEFVN